MSTEEQAPASYVQRAMWAVARRNRGVPLNVMILAWRIQGPLRVSSLEAASGDLIARHRALRTRLELSEGQLVQVIGAAEPVGLSLSDVEGATADARLKIAKDLLAAEGREPIDLSSGTIVRFRLLRLDATDHVLCIFVHHAMCDGWSSSILQRDLATFYRARADGATPKLPEISEQYADFAVSQMRTYERGGFADEVAFWKNELADLAPPIELPANASRKGNKDFRAASPVRAEPQEVLAILKDFARRRRVSLFSVLLSGLAVLLHQRTGGKDLVVGVSTANRWTRSTTQLVGCFTNLLPARVRLTEDTGIDELVHSVYASIRKLLAHGRIPLELILREVYGPLVSGTTFPLWCQSREPSPPAILESEGLTLTPVLIDRSAILCDLEADLIESTDGLECMFAHRAALFDLESILALLADYSAILRLMADEPHLLVRDICERV